MASDYIYYYTKDTFEQGLLGEIQSNFNMSKVIDGTKDSMKVQVLNFSGEEIEPLTILEHRATNTWWVVSHDKVERDMSESGFRYTHNLQLLGAIELLNARDLTDCGFNQNTYTIEEILYRLCRMSNFEFANNQDLNFEILSDELDINQNVDYMKTFENYTLLSALREVVSGYNCDIKLSFELTQDNKLYNALLTIIPKTGFSDKTPIEESEFSDVRETKTMDKNSFGTSVVSNAENVISTKSKTFPTTGAVRMSGTEYEITANDGVIRLPSNIFKVNWLKIYQPITIRMTVATTNDYSFTFFPIGDNDIMSVFNKMILQVYDWLLLNYTPQTIDFNKIKNYFETNKNRILSPMKKGGVITLYSDWKYNPVDKTFSAPTNNDDFYFPMIYRKFSIYNEPIIKELLIATEEQRNCIDRPERLFYYKKGENVIHCANILGAVNSPVDYSYINGYQYTDLRDSSYNPLSSSVYSYYIEDTMEFRVNSSQTINIAFALEELPWITVVNTYYKVNYIPMSDLKIKYDNSGERNDTQLYNQNGKLNDSVALSKLLLSYSKEIESDTITKYAHYYNYNGIPDVGYTVSIGNDIYVINNISYDFYENEEVDNSAYYIECEFTMSKKVGTKSLLTNPNSNIRDYGIPQNNNVVRKQLYRDFYELGHTLDTNASDDYYLSLDKIMNVSNSYQDYQDHIAVIKLGYEEEVDGKSNWYYQLDTTTYIFKKAIYEVVNFNDNNIIGYSSQNTLSEFDIRKVFSGTIDVINTPISYTDNNGKVESVEIAFCTNEQLTKIYDNFKQANGQGSNPKPIFNYSVFISGDIYEGADYGQTISYQGLIETGTLNVDPMSSVSYELTPYLGNYQGDGTDISIGSLSVYDMFYDREIPSNEYSYSFTKSGNKYYLKVQINPSSTYLTPMVKLYITDVLRGGFDGAKNINDFKIEEPSYFKDALEVPFFEYSCQIDNSDDVIIGDNILDTKNDGYTYMYSYVLVPKNQVNENSFTRYVIEPSGHFGVDDDFYIDVSNAIKMRYNNNKLCIGFRENDSFDMDNQTLQEGTSKVIDSTFLEQLKSHDLMIIRHKVDKYTTVEETEPNEGVFVYTAYPINDLMFVIRNTNNIVIDNNEILLTINHYKIK